MADTAATIATGAKRPAENAAPAKKAKVVDSALVRKQVEYYFSDDNLRSDKFFHDKISGDAEGWLDLKLILSCNKIKLMKIEASDVVSALGDSPLETKTDDTTSWVRRLGALPSLDANAGKQKRMFDEKKKASAHDGGVLIRCSEIPEDITWAPIKQRLRELMPESAKVMFATNVSEKNTCTVLFGPFENDLTFVENLTLDIDGVELKFEIVHGALLQECLKLLPKHIQKRREAQGKNRQKQRQKPVVLAGQKFPNVATVRAKVKEIIMARKDGQALVDGSPDTNLVRAVIAYHPRGEEKTKGMTGLKVDSSGHTSTQGKPSRCFFMVKEDGECEDISMVKCFNEMERKINEEKEEKDEAKAEETPTEKAAEKAAETPASPKKEAPGSPKKEAPGSPAAETPASPKKEAPGSPKKEAPGSPKKEAPGSPKKEPSSPKKA